MGLIEDYKSRNPVGLAIPPSEYDEEFVVASINAFINNLELIDNVILNNLANQNKAPYEHIKKRAEIKYTPHTLKLKMNIPNIPFTVNCELKQKFSLTQKSPENSQLSILKIRSKQNNQFNTLRLT